MWCASAYTRFDIREYLIFGESVRVVGIHLYTCITLWLRVHVHTRWVCVSAYYARIGPSRRGSPTNADSPSQPVNPFNAPYDITSRNPHMTTEKYPKICTNKETANLQSIRFASPAKHPSAVRARHCIAHHLVGPDNCVYYFHGWCECDD